jgi:hypothetical protein
MTACSGGSSPEGLIIGLTRIARLDRAACADPGAGPPPLPLSLAPIRLIVSVSCRLPSAPARPRGILDIVTPQEQTLSTHRRLDGRKARSGA